MTKTELAIELIKISNKLDNLGYTKLADQSYTLMNDILGGEEEEYDPTDFDDKEYFKKFPKNDYESDFDNIEGVDDVKDRLQLIEEWFNSRAKIYKEMGDLETAEASAKCALWIQILNKAPVIKKEDLSNLMSTLYNSERNDESQRKANMWSKCYNFLLEYIWPLAV